MKRIRQALPLLLSVLLLLGACAPSAPQGSSATTEQATEAATNAPASEIILSHRYQIIFPSNASETVQEATKQLMNDLQKKTGIFLPISSDAISPAATEICLATTNRTDFDAVLAPSEILIRAQGERIFILAASEDYLTAAIARFLELIEIRDGNAILSGELNVRESVEPIIPEEKTVSVKLLTYNIHNGADVAYNYRIIANDIKKSGAEIVALQEVDQNTNRNQNQDTMALLKEYTGWQYSYFVAGLESYQGGQYGVAILSKHPIVSTNSMELPETPGIAGLERRALLEVVVQIGELRLTCFVCHCNQKSITPQLQAMAQAAAGKSPYVIMGDFNYSGLALFQTVFPGASFANLSPTSIPTTDDGHCFDNMILSPGIKKGQVTVTETDHSDHHILACEVEIPLP